MSKIFTALKVVVASAFMMVSLQGFASNTPISDTAITGVIKAKIAADQTLSNTTIDVSTNNRVVKLSGSVKTDSDASELIQISQSVRGVNDVDTANLKVEDSSQPFTDMVITSKVKGLFIRERLFGKTDVPVMSINVETNNGIVSLTGTAESQKQADAALKLAQSVSGVKTVQSRVKIVSKI